MKNVFLYCKYNHEKWIFNVKRMKNPLINYEQNMNGTIKVPFMFKAYQVQDRFHQRYLR